MSATNTSRTLLRCNSRPAPAICKASACTPDGMPFSVFQTLKGCHLCRGTWLGRLLRPCPLSTLLVLPVQDADALQDTFRAARHNRPVSAFSPPPPFHPGGCCGLPEGSALSATNTSRTLLRCREPVADHLRSHHSSNKSVPPAHDCLVPDTWHITLAMAYGTEGGGVYVS